jgi:hypothetical protein
MFPEIKADNMHTAKYRVIPAAAPDSIIVKATGNEAKKYNVNLPVGITALMYNSTTDTPVNTPAKATFLLKMSPPIYLTMYSKCHPEQSEGS